MKNPKTSKEKVKETMKITTAQLSEEIVKAEGILSAIGDGISILDRTFKILYENQIHRDMLGDNAGKYCYRAYRQREGICSGCPVALTFKDSKVHTVQRKLQTDKETRYMEITASPLRDSKGNIIAGIEVIRDITERKQAEKALHESEAHLRAIIEDQTELICRFKADGTLTFVNEAYCRYFGKKSDQLIGYSFLPLIPEEDRETVLQRATSLSRENPIMTHEHKVLMPKGEVGWQQWTNRALYDEQGNFVECQSVGRDITERKQSEEKLKKSERILSSSFKALDGLLVILDKEHRVVMSNWKDHDFVPEDVLQGHPYCYEIFKNLEAPCDYCPPRDTFKDGKFRRYEDRNPADGSYKEISVSPVFDESGKIVFVIQHVRDITEKKRSDAVLAESKEKFKAIYESSNDAIMLLTEKGFFDCNKRTLEMFGFKDFEEFTKVHPADLSPPFQPDGVDSYTAAMERIQTAFRKGYNHFEWVHRRTDGTDFSADVLLTAFQYGGQTVLQATVRDITERKQAEQQLAIFKKFAETSSLAYGFAELNGDIVYINPTLCRILGEEKPEDALGKNVEIYYPDNMKSKLLNAVLPTVKSKGNWSGEIPLQSIKGKVTPTTQNISLIHDDKGKPIFIGNIITDITERKKSEAEIQKRIKELEDFYDMAVGRELRMKDLKEKIKELKQELEKYKKQ